MNIDELRAEFLALDEAVRTAMNEYHAAVARRTPASRPAV